MYMFYQTVHVIPDPVCMLVQTMYMVMQSRYMFHKTILYMADQTTTHMLDKSIIHMLRPKHHVSVKTRHVPVKTRPVHVKTRLSCTC